MLDRASKMIESVSEGTSPREAVKAQLDEGMDAYSVGYRCEDLQNSISRNVSDARSLLMKCKAYSASVKKNNGPDLEADLAKAHKQLESAEAAVLAACKKIDEYKEKQRNS